MLDDLLSIAALAGRVCLGLVFVTAAVGKMRHWRALEGVVGNYRLLPSQLVRPVTLLLPPFELILGAALLAGLMPRPSAILAMALLLIFAFAMAVNIRRGRDHIDCGCHQSFLRQTLRPILVARNLVLVAILLPATRPVADWLAPATLPLGLGLGFAFFLFYLTVNTVSALPRLDQPAT